MNQTSVAKMLSIVFIIIITNNLVAQSVSSTSTAAPVAASAESSQDIEWEEFDVPADQPTPQGEEWVEVKDQTTPQTETVSEEDQYGTITDDSKIITDMEDAPTISMDQPTETEQAPNPIAEAEIQALPEGISSEQTPPETNEPTLGEEIIEIPADEPLQEGDIILPDEEITEEGSPEEFGIEGTDITAGEDSEIIEIPADEPLQADDIILPNEEIVEDEGIVSAIP